MKEGGGLFLVEALCTRWDVVPTRDGKATCAELALSEEGAGGCGAAFAEASALSGA